MSQGVVRPKGWEKLICTGLSVSTQILRRKKNTCKKIQQGVSLKISLPYLGMFKQYWNKHWHEMLMNNPNLSPDSYHLICAFYYLSSEQMLNSHDLKGYSTCSLASIKLSSITPKHPLLHCPPSTYNPGEHLIIAENLPGIQGSEVLITTQCFISYITTLCSIHQSTSSHLSILHFWFLGIFFKPHKTKQWQQKHREKIYLQGSTKKTGP